MSQFIPDLGGMSGLKHMKEKNILPAGEDGGFLQVICALFHGKAGSQKAVLKSSGKMIL